MTTERPGTQHRRWVAELVGARADKLTAQALFHDEVRPLPELPKRTPVLRAGDIVLCEPQQSSRHCRIVGQPLARAGTFRADLYRVLAGFGLDPVYPPPVWQEAKKLIATPGVDDEALEDLSDLPFVTIDNPDSRDLDQALFITRSGDGYLVQYALADASYYVRPGTALFAYAIERGASFYLPGLVVPMLPPMLSEGVVSLNQGVPRRALVFRMRLDGDGVSEGTELVRARVLSAAKLSYPGVQRYYDDPGGSAIRHQPYRQSLDLLAEVGRLRLDQVRRRHVVQYRRSELDITPAERARLGFRIASRTRLPVERFNEQISLLCNIQGARLLVETAGLAYVQPIFRVHPAPGPAAVASLESFLSALVERTGLDPSTWQWRSQGPGGEPLADYLERLPTFGARARLTRAIERQALLMNQRSTFADHPAAHHGVGAEHYARFSAPMREVVGIFTHKEALDALAGENRHTSVGQDLELREQVTDAGNRAKQVQRQLTKRVHRLALDRLLQDDIIQQESLRPRRSGTVMGLTSSRIYVQLDEPRLEVKVYVGDLERQLGTELELVEPGIELAEHDGARVLHLGDRLVVWVAGYDERRQRWRFALEEG